MVTQTYTSYQIRTNVLRLSILRSLWCTQPFGLIVKVSGIVYVGVIKPKKTEIPSSIKSQNSSSIMNIFFWKALHPFCLKSRQETVFTTVCLSADMMEMLIGYATLATKSILVAYLFSPPPFAHSSLAHNLYLSHTNTYEHTQTHTNTYAHTQTHTNTHKRTFSNTLHFMHSFSQAITSTHTHANTRSHFP